MTPREVMPKTALQQRLMATSAPRGAGSTLRPQLYMPDIAAFLHIPATTLRACAQRKRDIDDALQVQLSNFFMLWDQGLLAKQRGADSRYEIVRLPAKTGAAEPPRAKIDLSGMIPKISWSR